MDLITYCLRVLHSLFFIYESKEVAKKPHQHHIIYSLASKEELWITVTSSEEAITGKCVDLEKDQSVQADPEFSLYKIRAIN